MISVAALRMQQFGVQFYQASLSAKDIDKLVRFEVLNYGEPDKPGVRGAARQSKVRLPLAAPLSATASDCVSPRLCRRAISPGLLASLKL